MFNEKELKQRQDRRLAEIKVELEESGKLDLGWNAWDFMHGPRAELLARLNAGVRGIDPGEPVNWRGL